MNNPLKLCECVTEQFPGIVRFLVLLKSGKVETSNIRFVPAGFQQMRSHKQNSPEIPVANMSECLK